MRAYLGRRCFTPSYYRRPLRCPHRVSFRSRLRYLVRRYDPLVLHPYRKLRLQLWGRLMFRDNRKQRVTRH